jgi:hypothetical protein
VAPGFLVVEAIDLIVVVFRPGSASRGYGRITRHFCGAEVAAGMANGERNTICMN